MELKYFIQKLMLRCLVLETNKNVLFNFGLNIQIYFLRLRLWFRVLGFFFVFNFGFVYRIIIFSNFDIDFE